jgi:hypothetical protein
MPDVAPTKTAVGEVGEREAFAALIAESVTILRIMRRGSLGMSDKEVWFERGKLDVVETA